MPWKLAPSLETLLKQVNALAPNRSKDSDGTIGDTAHSSRASDHNPDKGGIVRAIDFTNDPDGGCDAQKLADVLVAAKDPRIKYIISRGRIVSGSGQKQPAWQWRKYTGSNKHEKHVHISVKAGAAGDAGGQWQLGSFGMVKPGTEPAPAPAKPVPVPKPVPEAVTKARIWGVQERLKELGYTEVGGVDGVKGDLTNTAILAFRSENGLPLSTDIDRAFLDALDAAKPRKLAPERENATPAVVAEKVPEAESNWWTRFWAKWSTWGTIGGATTGGVAKALEYTGAAKERLDPVRDFLPNMSTVALLLLFAAVTFIIWRQATKTDKAQVEAFQTGARR